MGWTVFEDGSPSGETRVRALRERTIAAVLYALFFLSGTSALAFQIAWPRRLSTGLGQEIPAVLAVVGAIFGGMTTGAWASERILSTSGRPGRWYGWLELVAGLGGLASIGLIPWINEMAPAFAGLETPRLAQALLALWVSS